MCRVGGVTPRSRRAERAVVTEFLTVTAVPSAGVLVLRVVGEVDLGTVEPLRECLRKYVPGDHRGVVLDCTRVSFLAACGIGLLVETADRARLGGMALRLVAPGRMARRILEVTLADQLVPHAPTVAEAVTQCVACSGAAYRRRDGSSGQA
jgi:anti-sigma B factor antagonist